MGFNGLTVGLLVFLIGLWGLFTKKNLIKIIICLNIATHGIILFFISLGYRLKGQAPIMEEGVKAVVDPLPQALMITTIVIELGITALALALAMVIYRRFHTLDTRELFK